MKAPTVRSAATAPSTSEGSHSWRSRCCALGRKVKTKTLSDAAAEAIRGSTIEGNELRLPAQMDRKLYQEVNAVLESIGGKWAKGRKAHVFPTDVPIEEKLSAIVDAGRVALPSKNGYFPTPAWLVDYMLGLADIEPHHTVLEPSAGQGAIADRVREITGPENVFCVELLPENASVLRSKGYEVVEGDFLSLEPPKRHEPTVDPNEIQKGEEEWRPVVGYEEIYEVSSWGRIRRLQTRKRYQAGTLLTPSPRADGYLNVVLAANGDRESKLLHQIVAEAFLGPCPEGIQVNHRHPDGDRSRCWLSNLEYRTIADNNEDQRIHRPAAYATRERIGISALKSTDLPEIRRALAMNCPVHEIAQRFGVADGTIYAIRDCKSWSLRGRLFDRVIANPPFEKQADIDHVLHAWAHLKPGGRLVSVMSAGVTFREDRKTRAFRDFLNEHGALVETNPEGAFKESGTGVSTVLVAITRPAAASAPAELNGQHEPMKAGVNGAVAPPDGVETGIERGGAAMPRGEAVAKKAPPVDLGLNDAPAADTGDQVTLVVLVAIDAITPSPENPRKTFDEDEIAGLAASIEAHGLMQPLVVRRKDDEYELIAGERRLRALQLLGRQTAPAIVQPDVDDRQALELALVENIQRVQLNPVEEARAIALMHDRVGLTAAQIAERLGKKVGYVERALAILALPDEVLAELDTGRLSAAQAGALATWSGHPKIVQLMAYHAITRKVSAATIEESALPFADQLYGDGLVTEVSHKAYRDEVCQLCPLQALVMERRDGYQDRFWCLKPTHAAELDVEFEHKKARDQESARVEARSAHLEVDPDEKRAKAPDLSRLPYSTYETIGYRMMPPSCTGECPCRAVCRGSGDQLVEICLDTGRLRALKAGATRQKNKSAKTSKDGLLTDALIELDRMTAGDRRPLAILAQVVLERLGYDGRRVLDRALERYLPGVKLQPANRWKTTASDYDRLAELDPALLLQTLAGALVFSEVGQKESSLTVTRYLAGLRETAAGDAPEPEAGGSDGDEEDGESVTDVADDGSEIEVDTSWYDDIRDELEPPDGE
jgi:ParB family transcriptional regulator, chromosome partitioning protein